MTPKLDIACRQDLDRAAAGAKCKCGRPECQVEPRVALMPLCHPGPAIAVYAPADGCLVLSCQACGRAFVRVQVAGQVPS
jgi:hypothetical protein